MNDKYSVDFKTFNPLPVIIQMTIFLKCKADNVERHAFIKTNIPKQILYQGYLLNFKQKKVICLGKYKGKFGCLQCIPKKSVSTFS
jgi:hypothetical protein